MIMKFLVYLGMLAIVFGIGYFVGKSTNDPFNGQHNASC